MDKWKLGTACVYDKAPRKFTHIFLGIINIPPWPKTIEFLLIQAFIKVVFYFCTSWFLIFFFCQSADLEVSAILFLKIYLYIILPYTEASESIDHICNLVWPNTIFLLLITLTIKCRSRTKCPCLYCLEDIISSSI